MCYNSSSYEVFFFFLSVSINKFTIDRQLIESSQEENNVYRLLSV